MAACNPGGGNVAEENLSTDIKNTTWELESYESGTASFRITTGMKWIITKGSGWIAFDPDDGTGDADITMTFTENTAPESREVKFSITGVGNTDNTTLAYTLIQPGFTDGPGGEYYLRAEPRNITGIPYAGVSNRTISITANVPWSATAVDGWITVNGGEGTGNGSFTYSVAANDGEERTGSIRLTCTDPSFEVTDITVGIEQERYDQGGTGELPYGWLELPKVVETDDNHFSVLYAPVSGNSRARNYSMLYDYNEKIAYWVAYPMHPVYLDGSGRSSWSYNPNVPQQYQVSDYASGYSKGHQIPSGDRHSPAGSTLNKQTFYYTNMTPQLQNGFNGTIWNNMEQAVRNWTEASSDTLYVVTGAVLNKIGENKEVKRESLHNVVIPNYYYKVIIKKKRNSSTEYTAIGFWFEHRNYSETKPSHTYSLTVDQIEEWTGLDFFANLPEDVQNRIESIKETSEWNL